MSVICDEFGYVQYPNVKRSDRKTIISNLINVKVPEPISRIPNQGILYMTLFFIVFFVGKIDVSNGSGEKEEEMRPVGDGREFRPFS